jgi:uncharacterized membrane protein YedE/YeeE
MKKRIIFFILWDVVFIIFLYLTCRVENAVLDGYYRMNNPYPAFFVLVVLRIAAGALICWLALVSMKYEISIKSAVLEFVIIGGLAFYLATFVISYFFIPVVLPEYLRFLRPSWIMMDRNMVTITLGAVLFGYELLMFIYRMVSFRKKSKLSEPKQESI